MADWDGKITVEWYEQPLRPIPSPLFTESGWVAKSGEVTAWGALPEDAVRTLMDQLVTKALGEPDAD